MSVTFLSVSVPTMTKKERNQPEHVLNESCAEQVLSTQESCYRTVLQVFLPWLVVLLDFEFTWACGPPITMKIGMGLCMYSHKAWTAQV